MATFSESHILYNTPLFGIWPTFHSSSTISEPHLYYTFWFAESDLCYTHHLSRIWPSLSSSLFQNPTYTLWPNLHRSLVHNPIYLTPLFFQTPTYLTIVPLSESSQSYTPPIFGIRPTLHSFHFPTPTYFTTLPSSGSNPLYTLSPFQKPTSRFAMLCGCWRLYPDRS